MSGVSSRNGSLTRSDKRLLAVTLCSVLVLIVLIAVFGPSQDEKSLVPSTYSNGPHGARAAFLLLERSGYRVVRSTDGLAKVAQTASPQATYIFAEPFYEQTQDARASVQKILERGGRVLATGYTGALLLPEQHAGPLMELGSGTCTAKPSGLSPVASSSEVSMALDATWVRTDLDQEVAYRCSGNPVVVTYPYAKGQVVWWASATPLENGTIEDKGDLALLLNSIGAGSLGGGKAGTIVWDESLHGESPSLLSYTAGTALPFLWVQFGLVALLLLLSAARRSGPLRADPVISRAAQLEFVRALGSLYRKAGATGVTVAVAYQDLRIAMSRAAGVSAEATPRDAATALARRFAVSASDLEQTLRAAEEATHARLSEKDALSLVRALQAAETAMGKTETSLSPKLLSPHGKGSTL
jgi:hypothetical protein